MGNEDTGLLSENWLMEGVKSQNAHNSGFLQCRLMHCWENLEKFPITGGGRRTGGGGLTVFAFAVSSTVGGS